MESMRKKMLSIIASMAMVLSLFVLPGSIFAETSDATEITTETSTLTEGDYILNENVTLPSLRFESGKNVNIDLNNHVLTLDGNSTIEIKDGAQIGITNGTIKALNISDGTKSLFNIQKNSSIMVDNATIDTTGTALFPQGNAASVTVTNSIIKAGVYAVGTNASGPDNYGVNITLSNSEFSAPHGYKNADNDNCVVMINVPGTLKMNQCKVIGDRQALVVRSGTVSVTDCEIVNTGKYSKHNLYLDKNWSSGNEFPMASILVGDRSGGTAYSKGDSSLSIYNTIITSEKSDVPAIYAYQQDKSLDLYSRSITIEGMNTLVNGSIEKNDNIVLDIHEGKFSEDVTSYINRDTTTIEKSDEGYVVYPTAKGISLDRTSANMQIGDSLTLKATVEPTESLDTVTWSSSDNTVATVDDNGKVTAVGAGKAIITANAGKQTATCEVTVYGVESDVEAPVIDTSIPVDEVTVGINDKESQQNISETLTSIVDNIANDKEVTSVNQKTAENIKQAINNGEVVSTEVQVKPVEASQVDAQDKKVIEDYIDEKTNIAQYIDISVVIKADNAVIGEVNELNKEVTFTVAIPEDLMKEGRTFYVIRVHDGKAEKLDTVENEDGTLTFKTDKFSTYALAYEDAQESITTPITPVQPAQPGQSQDDVKGETVVTPDNNQQVANTQNTQETAKEPKTGDTSNIALYGAMALISLGLVGAVVLKKKVSEK